MAVVTFPESLSFSSMYWTIHRNDIGSYSRFGSQSQEVTGPQWMVTAERGPILESEAGAWKALMLKWRGSIDQLALWDHARPVPVGTLRGTTTLREAVAPGDTTLKITCDFDQLGKTLVEGDWLGLGSGTSQQLFMVMEPVETDDEPRTLSLDFTTQTYEVGGPPELDVVVQPPARAAHSAGALVQWDKPKALFRRLEPNAGWGNEKALVSGFQVNLIEDPRP